VLVPVLVPLCYPHCHHLESTFNVCCIHEVILSGGGERYMLKKNKMCLGQIAGTSHLQPFSPLYCNCCWCGHHCSDHGGCGCGHGSCGCHPQCSFGLVCVAFLLPVILIIRVWCGSGWPVGDPDLHLQNPLCNYQVIVMASVSVDLDRNLQ
jgi:hypothetical protein